MKKIMLFILSVIFIFSFSLFCFACSSQGQVKLNGFEFSKQEISVTQNSPVTVETPLVTLESGERVELLYEVVDSKGQYVQLSAGTFIANDLEGYTIKYVVKQGDKAVASKDIKVNVTGASSLAVSATYEKQVETGTEITINASYPDGATVTYQVLYGTEEIQVQDGKFTASKDGSYIVTITATKDGQTGYYAYEITAKTQSLLGEIELFNENWQANNETLQYSRKGWQQVNSADTTLTYGANKNNKLLDRFGEESGFAYFTTTNDPEDFTGNLYLKFNINPRNDIDYYKQLVEQGYEYVSIWVYIDGEKNHNNTIYGDKTSTIYNIESNDYGRANPMLEPNQWTELKLGLYDGALNRKPEYRSFISGYNNYVNGSEFLFIDNSLENFINGKLEQESGKITVYIDDIYAVRAVDNAMIDLADNATIDIANIVNKNGQTYVGEGFTYKVYENGKLIGDSLETGLHNLQVKVLLNGQFYENRQVVLNVINSSKSVALQTVTADPSKARVVEYGMNTTGQLVVETPVGRTGDYYKVVFSNENKNVAPGLRILPELNKEGLNAYAGGYLYFEYYASDVISSLRWCTDINGDAFGKLDNFKNNCWQSAYIPVSDLLENYDKLVNTFSKVTNEGIMLRFGKSVATGAGYVYLSQFTLVKEAVPVSVQNDQNVTPLNSVSGGKTVNYTLSAEKIAQLGLTDKDYYVELNGVKAQGTTLTLANGVDGTKYVISVYQNDSAQQFAQLVYNETITVVDSSLQRTFLDIDLSNVHLTSWGSPQANQISVVQDPEGKQGTYFKAHYNDDTSDPTKVNNQAGLKVNSSLEKSILRMYSGGYLKFDFYNGSKFNKLHLLTDDNGNGTITVDIVSGWNQIIISVDDLLKYYDVLKDNFNPTSLNNLGKLWTLPGDATEKSEATLYFGNFIVYPNDIYEEGVDFNKFFNQE